MMNELTRPLTGAEERLGQEQLAALLVRQIALYTANESSSVPAAAARELLRGVLFFLAVPEEPEASSQPEDVGSRYEAERADRIRVPLPLDLADELARGQRRAQRDAALTIALWRKVVETLPPLENRSLRDTLRSIGRGFHRYDTRFFPQRFDCDIDYQLAVPVSESLLGINYVNRYLTHLAAEYSLLTRLPQGEVRAVLERSCPDWRGLLVNLYAPVAANALARTLLGGEGLTLSDGEIDALRERWKHARPEQIMADLLAAEDALAERLILPRGAGKYLNGFAREVAARAEALRDCGGLHGMLNGGVTMLEFDPCEAELRMSQDLTRLNRTVWNREMTGHRFLGDGTSRQQSRFADGTAVTVDFAENWYKIELSDGETLCGQGLPYEKNAE